MAKDIGYQFEDELKAVFESLKSKQKFYYHRYVDSKAAKKYVSAQPADFQIIYNGTVCMVEAKASEEYESLVSCASSSIRPQQIGKMKGWLRAGGRGIFLFYSEITGEVELWPAAHVLAQRKAGQRLNRQLCLIFDYNTLEEDLAKWMNFEL